MLTRSNTLDPCAACPFPHECKVHPGLAQRWGRARRTKGEEREVRQDLFPPAAAESRHCGGRGEPFERLSKICRFLFLTLSSYHPSPCSLSVTHPLMWMLPGMMLRPNVARMLALRIDRFRRASRTGKTSEPSSKALKSEQSTLLSCPWPAPSSTKLSSMARTLSKSCWKRRRAMCTIR